MERPEDDPRFPELKAMIQEGIDSLERGEFYTHEEVWAHVRETIIRVGRETGQIRD